MYGHMLHVAPDRFDEIRPGSVLRSSPLHLEIAGVVVFTLPVHPFVVDDDLVNHPLLAQIDHKPVGEDVFLRIPLVRFAHGPLTVDGAIRFGFAGIKNVGAGAIEAIIDTRESEGPFESVFDFVWARAYMSAASTVRARSEACRESASLASLP